ERQFIGTTIERLMRGVMLLIALFKSSINNNRNPPGPFDPKVAAFPKELEENFDTTNNDLEIDVDRIAINASDVRKVKTTLERRPPKAWLSSSELWMLHDHPLVRIDDKDPYRFVLSMSPDRLQPKCAKFLLNEIVKFYETNKTFKAKDRAYELRGVALE